MSSCSMTFAVIIVHELINKLSNSYFRHVAMSLVSNDPHGEYVR